MLSEYLILSILLVSSYFDLKTKKITDITMFIILVMSLLNADNILSAAITGALVFIFLVMINFNNSIGGGDIKLLSALSVGVGFLNILYILLFALTIMIVVSKIAKGTKEIPFCPMIAISYFIFIGGTHFV